MAAPSWPKPILDGSPRSWSLRSIFAKREDMLKAPDDYTSMYQPNQRWLNGYAIPPFQRNLEWDVPRMIRYIESAALGLHIGTWVYNCAIDAPMTRSRAADGSIKETWHETDLWLIDGQQRMTALDWFWADRFKVFGSYWSDLTIVQQRKFLNNTTFSAFETRIYDRNILRELSDRLNFGGVAHRPDQRATKGGENLLPSAFNEELDEEPDEDASGLRGPGM